jgi:hypothetical protein
MVIYDILNPAEICTSGKNAQKQIARGYDTQFILLLVSPYRFNHFKDRGHQVIFRIFCCSLWKQIAIIILIYVSLNNQITLETNETREPVVFFSLTYCNFMSTIIINVLNFTLRSPLLK